MKKVKRNKEFLPKCGFIGDAYRGMHYLLGTMAVVLSLYMSSCSKDDDSQETNHEQAEKQGVQMESVSLKAVDLGLSVKWANMNVGATKIEDFGSRYAWGETSVKEAYNQQNFTGGSQYSISGTSSDAAKANMGENWRMPTAAEMQELVDKCIFSVEELNGVKGARFTAANGNSIFLPAAGWKNNQESEVGQQGAYRAGTGSGKTGIMFKGSFLDVYTKWTPECGMSIRAVTEISSETDDDNNTNTETKNNLTVEAQRFVGKWEGRGPLITYAGGIKSTRVGTWLIKDDGTFSWNSTPLSGYISSRSGKWHYNSEEKMLITNDPVSINWKILDVTDDTWTGKASFGDTYTYIRVE